MDKDIFESINLQSTVVVPKRVPISKHRSKIPQLPESVSGTSDEERYEMEEESEDYNVTHDEDEDPADHLLFPSSQMLHDSKKIPEDEFFLNPSQILSTNTSIIQDPPQMTKPKISLQMSQLQLATSMYESIRFPDQTLHSNNTQGNTATESPLEFLTNKNKILFNEINHNIDTHSHYLILGDEHLKRVRLMISQNFEQISENYYSLNELHASEIASTETLFDTFEKWDQRRLQLLDKIKSIKNPDHKHGHKLATLLDEAKAVDTEIEDLEDKLEKLRAKKLAICGEIHTTSSVLESKTARYVEMFKTLELQGKAAIINYLQYNGQENDLSGFIRNSSIDVTFLREYNHLRPDTKKDLEPIQEETSQKPSTAINNMGIQPFVIPDEVKSAQKLDKESYDHGHGPSAYDEGYQKGAQISINALHKLQEIIAHLKQSLIRGERVNKEVKSRGKILVDDHANTITEKVDLDPVVQLLDNKISAVSDLVLHTSTKATIYHQYHILWGDVTNILDLQEKNLLAFVTESKPSIDALDPSLEGILTSTLSQLKACIENLIQYQSTLSSDFLFGSHNPMYQALVNEISAIVSALTIFSNPNTEDGILLEFISMGFSKQDLLHQKEVSSKPPKSHKLYKTHELPKETKNTDMPHSNFNDLKTPQGKYTDQILNATVQPLAPNRKPVRQDFPKVTTSTGNSVFSWSNGKDKSTSKTLKKE